MDIPFGIQEKPFKQIKKNGKSLKLNIIIDLQNKETWHMLSKAYQKKSRKNLYRENFPYAGKKGYSEKTSRPVFTFH